MCDENFYFILWAFICAICLIGLFFANKKNRKYYKNILDRLFAQETELFTLNGRNPNSESSKQDPLIKT